MLTVKSLHANQKLDTLPAVPLARLKHSVIQAAEAEGLRFVVSEVTGHGYTLRLYFLDLEQSTVREVTP